MNLRAMLWPIGLLAPTVALLAMPAHVSADYTCTSKGGHVDIAMREIQPAGDFAPAGPSIVTHPGGAIFTAACPPGATVTNTSSFTVTDTAPELTRRVSINADAGPFAPGMPLEPDGTSEIEFDIDLGPPNPAPDTVDLALTGGTDDVEIGRSRTGLTLANLNAGAELDGSSDADVSIAGLSNFAPFGVELRSYEFVAAYGQEGDDRITAQGGPGIPRPAAVSLTLQGFEGDDELTGGTRADELAGDSGDDRHWGMEGNDYLTGADGRDLLKGGDGKDAIEGGPGPDRLVGNGGKDSFDGGASADFIKSRDGRGEAVRCGPGRDEVRADEEDEVNSDCERVSVG
jgi:hypothetical protein